MHFKSKEVHGICFTFVWIPELETEAILPVEAIRQYWG